MSHRVILLWTVPRSVSTSFERMVSERGDHIVFDEPFSRSYYYGPDRRSARYSETIPHSSAEEVLAEIEEAALERPVFVKDMAYHAAKLLGPDLLQRFDNCFLVRDPAATVRSLARRWPDFSDDESGWAHLDEAAHIADALGQPRVVLDANLLCREHGGGGGGLVRPHGPSLRPRRPDLGARDAPRVGPLGRLARLHRALHRLQRAARPAASTHSRRAPPARGLPGRAPCLPSGWRPTPSVRPLPPRTSAASTRWMRYVKQRPGHQLQVDVHVHRAARVQNGRKKRYYQYTAIDDCTRLRILRVLPAQRPEDRHRRSSTTCSRSCRSPSIRFRPTTAQEFGATFHCTCWTKASATSGSDPRTPRLNGKVETVPTASTPRSSTVCSKDRSSTQSVPHVRRDDRRGGRSPRARRPRCRG